MEAAILSAILISLVGWIVWACRALARLVDRPGTARPLDEHERAIAGADPFGE